MAAFILLLLLKLCISQEYPICQSSNKVCDVAGGECCSMYGWCGTGSPWCSDNSQYGVEGSRTDDEDRGICGEVEETCGPCECCFDGSCGTGSEFCNSDSEYRISPSCGSVPTPTPPPTQEPFTGCTCFIEGDPHVHTWSCGRINYQGPHVIDPPGAFRYVTKCANSQAELPFEVVGTHARWGDYFTVLDYITLVLYDITEATYYVRVSGETGLEYSMENDNETSLMPIEETTVTQIGDGFEIQWTRDVHGIVHTTLSVIESPCETDLTITSRYFEGNDEGIVSQESASIEVCDSWKSGICGLCGDFETRYPEFIDADGNTITVDDGYFGETGENWNAFGYYLFGTRGYGEEPVLYPPQRRRRRQKSKQRRRLGESELNYTVSTMETGCFNMEDDLFTMCTDMLDDFSDCCNSRHNYCEDNTVHSCAVDACACINLEGYSTLDEVVNNGVDAKCVNHTMNVLLGFTCNLDDTKFVIPDDTVGNSGVNAISVVFSVVFCFFFALFN